ncbi:hypothetical protein HDU97_002353 [Phlyctochytrium planicorne]|nr:hypothetical protein HDU97_002353 [Phlyctochytrium planicorne]
MDAAATGQPPPSLTSSESTAMTHPSSSSNIIPSLRNPPPPPPPYQKRMDDHDDGDDDDDDTNHRPAADEETGLLRNASSSSSGIIGSTLRIPLLLTASLTPQQRLEQRRNSQKRILKSPWFWARLLGILITFTLIFNYLISHNITLIKNPDNDDGDNSPEDPSLPHPLPPSFPDDSNDDKDPSQIDWIHRRDAVVQAFDHAWAGYSKYAMGADELRPISRKGRKWLHLGITIFDTLDTALILNRPKAFQECLDWVLTQFSFNTPVQVDISVFETTIRVLGGTLAAYHLSGEKQELKDLAIKIGNVLLKAFNDKDAIPSQFLRLPSLRPVHVNPEVATADVSTTQLEFKYLSHITGDPKYWNAVEKVNMHLHKLEKFDGLAPIQLKPRTGEFSTNVVSMGAMGDSYYEYLAKQYILTNLTQPIHLQQFQTTVEGLKTHLLSRSTPSNLLHLTDLHIPNSPKRSPKKIPQMHHLACFYPGTLSLFATKGKPHPQRSSLSLTDQESLHIAEELTRTCYETYHQTPTHIGPEQSIFNVNTSTNITSWLETFRTNARAHKERQEEFVPVSESLEVKDGEHELDFKVDARGYDLRPEVVESLFYLYRATGDVKYRRWGWKMFKGIEKYAKAKHGGYCNLETVLSTHPKKRDIMESFFIGETLKYFYLLFSDETVLPLDKYVFNTEAHPLPIFEIREDMKDRLVIME